MAGPEKNRVVEYTVDAQLASEIAKLWWCRSPQGYLQTTVKQLRIEMHHLVWDLCGGQKPEPGQEIDHIDRDPTNNSAANLRLITQKGNILNRRGDCVRFRPSKSKDGAGAWEVRIGIDSKRWTRTYADEDTARLVAKHKKESMIEREVIAYVS